MQTAPIWPSLLSKVLICVALAACGASETHKVVPGGARRSGVEACQDRAKALEDAQEAQRQADIRLSAIAGSPKGDAVSEAKTAMNDGDFRFVGYSMLVPGIFPAAYGVQCKPAIVSQRDRLVRAVWAASDVIGSQEELEAQRDGASHFERFGMIYNKTLLADPRYPYHDFCRAAVQNEHYPFDQTAKPHEYGYRDLQPTDQPIDLGEAARRGSLESLKRMIVSDRRSINKPDILGMTPLAWAIAYRREAQAKALLRAGASPAGADCQQISEPTSPIQIARALMWRSMVEKMLSHVKTPDVKELSDPPQRSERSIHSFNVAVKAAVEHYAPKLGQHPLLIHHALVSVDTKGNVQSCEIVPTTSLPALDLKICIAMRHSSPFEPARNLFGEPVVGEASFLFKLPAKSLPSSNSAPIGTLAASKIS